jgi:predicted CXXCH cytochrome family protein
MFTRLEKIIIALMFALLAAGITLIVANAQGPTPPATITTSSLSYDTCIGCHADVNATWMQGPHGQALSDPIFAAAWNSQGQPGACLVCHTTGYDPATGQSNAEGVTCEACHSPVPANHPTDNMPVDNSPDLCGKCHSDPRFSTENWKLSAHYQRNMTCSVCHDAHTAGMKTVVGAGANLEDASNLCENCHKDAMDNFPSSKHAAAGVTCVNCHLGFNVNGNDTVTMDFGDAHKAPDHGFRATLDTCNKCHTNQMHGPGQAVAAAAIKIEEAGGTATPEPTPAVTPIAPVTTQSPLVSPLGFAGMAGLLGLAGGMVLAPWLEKLYNRFAKGGKND